MIRKHPSGRATIVAAVAVLAAAGLAACGSSGSGDPNAKKIAFQLTDKGCTPATAKVPAGPVRFEISNPGSQKTDEFELKNKDGIIMGERENLAPGLGGDFTLTLQPGSYVLNCTFQNDQRDNGKLVVTGAATEAKAAADDPELAQGVKTYQTYVKSETTKLVANTERFVAALRAGRLQEAKDLFAVTRVNYESIEPIAESFGTLDPDIDARVNDVAEGDPWTGFHHIEQILWVKGTTDGTSALAAKLLTDVRTLDDKIDGLELQAPQIANGAVGLLDDVSHSKITGEEDRYSHTDLADFQANFTGALEAFRTLEPALKARGETTLIKQVTERAAAVQTGLDKYKRPGAPSGFAPYSALTPGDRRAFAQQVSALAEPLSLVAGKVLVAKS